VARPYTAAEPVLGPIPPILIALAVFPELPEPLPLLLLGWSLLPQAVMLMTMAAAKAKAKNFFIFQISFSNWWIDIQKSGAASPAGRFTVSEQIQL